MNTLNDIAVDFGRLFNTGRGGAMNSAELAALELQKQEAIRQNALQQQVYNYYMANGQTQPQIQAARQGEQQITQNDQMFPGVLAQQKASLEGTQANTAGQKVQTAQGQRNLDQQQLIDNSSFFGETPFNVGVAETQAAQQVFGASQEQKKAKDDEAASSIAGAFGLKALLGDTGGHAQGTNRGDNGKPIDPPQLEQMISAIKSPDQLNMMMQTVGNVQNSHQQERGTNIEAATRAMGATWGPEQQGFSQYLQKQLGITAPQGPQTNPAQAAAQAVQAMRQQNARPVPVAAPQGQPSAATPGLSSLTQGAPAAQPGQVTPQARTSGPPPRPPLKDVFYYLDTMFGPERASASGRDRWLRENQLGPNPAPTTSPQPTQPTQPGTPQYKPVEQQTDLLKMLMEMGMIGTNQTQKLPTF